MLVNEPDLDLCKISSFRYKIIVFLVDKGSVVQNVMLAHVKVARIKFDNMTGCKDF